MVMPEKRDQSGKKNATSFQPGKSGNPGGRPKIADEVRELARAYTKQAVQTLHDVMTDEEQPGPARVSAASALLDRAAGKPTTPVEHSADDSLLGPPEDRIALITQILGLSAKKS